MAVRATNRYGFPYYFDTVNGPLPGGSLWERFGSVVKQTEPQTLVVYDEDFLDVTIGTNTIPGWTFTAATSGAITQDTTNPGGIMLISAGAATANQGVNWQLNSPAFKIAAGKPVAFEVYGKFTGLTNLKLQTFLGLTTISTAVIAAGAMATLDRVGFQGITTTGVLTSVARQTGTAVTGTGVTLVDATFYRLGFFATSTQIDFYVNGLIVSSLTTQIPTVAVAPTVVVQANATDTPVLALDRIRVAGYR